MMLKSKYFLIAVILVIFIPNFIRYAQRAPRRNYGDFRVYYATAERFVQKEDIYSRPDEAITPYKYSPVFAMLIAPMSFLSKNEASQLFWTLNFIALIAVLVLSKRIIGVKLSYGYFWVYYFFIILFVCRYIEFVWDSGQITLLMLLLVLGGLYQHRQGKVVLAAAMIGLAVMFKYMPFIFIPYFFFRKQYKLVGVIGLFMILYMILPMSYVGIDQGVSYLKSWLPFISETSLDGGSLSDIKNQSFYSMCLRYLSVGSDYGVPSLNLARNTALLISALAGGLLYVLILMPARGDNKRESIDFALLMICMAIFNPNAWPANFVLQVFAYMYLLNHLFEARFKDATTLLLMFFGFAISSWSGESVFGNDIENLFYSYSATTIGALLLFAALLRLKFNPFNLKKGRKIKC